MSKILDDSTGGGGTEEIELELTSIDNIYKVSIQKNSKKRIKKNIAPTGKMNMKRNLLTIKS